MDQHTRRVGTVRLRARDEALVRRGAVLVEDALRTASWPDDHGRRLLFVRRLAIGQVHPDRGASSVAVQIEHALLEIGGAIVHAGEPAAPAAPAVYFHDPLDVSVTLAVMLARGERPTAWFWRLAAPYVITSQTCEAALVAVIMSTLEGELGVAAAAVLLDQLARRDAVDPLLASLGAHHGPALLALARWSRPATATRPNPPARTDVWAGVAPPLRAPVRRWIGRWGADDARSFWLAAIGLAAHHPARLMDSGLLERAREVAAHAHDGVRTPAQCDIADAPSRRDDAIAVADRDASDAFAPDRAADPTATHGPAARMDRHRPEANAEGSGGVDSSSITHRSSRMPAAGATDEAFVSDADAGERPQRLSHPASEGAPTEYAGLWFLLAVMERLKIHDFLTEHPHLVDADLPRCLLRAVADHLGIPPDDAVMTALGGERVTGLVPNGFHAPTAWIGPLGDPDRFAIARVAGRAGVRVLLDASGRMPLALWQGSAPEAVRARLTGKVMARSAALADGAEPDVLVSAWLVAMRRWCRRFAHLGVASLVRCAGRVRSTATHLDVTLDLRRADVRVRRAGLDLNPGWIPWFGRVVEFHYRFGGTPDA